MDHSPQYRHTSATHPWLRDLIAGSAQRTEAMDPAAIAAFRAALSAEMVFVLRYRRQHFATGGAHPRSVDDRTLPPFDGDTEHAAWIAARIVELHGGVDFMPQSLPPLADATYIAGKSLRDMIGESLAAERASIGIYSELIRRFGAEDPGTRGMLEAVVAAEQGHATHLERLLAVAPRQSRRTTAA